MGVQVVGGGIIGMSIAWRLAQRGFDVTVSERSRIGSEASWAGAGMLAPGGEYLERSRWSDLGIKSLALYPEYVRELEAESGSTIDFRVCGALETARTDQEGTDLRQRAISQLGMGVRSEAVSERQVFFPDDAVVNPRQILYALRVACERRGVTIQENTAVTSVKGTVVIAAGAWSGGIHTSGALEASFPVRGHLVSYRSPGSPGPILRSGHTYILHRASRTTIAGSSVERVGFNRTIDPAIVADIDRRAHDLLPELGEVQEAWLGFRPATASLEPQVGRIPGTDIFYAYGHYRNGILLAPVTAQMIASQFV